MQVQRDTTIVGSTLLRITETFALNNHNTSHEVMSDNIGNNYYNYVCHITVDGNMLNFCGTG